MSKFARILRYATSDGVPRCSLNVALVVGSTLNLINQGDALLESAEINWPKLLLTFCVPYFVSTYSAIASRLRNERYRARQFYLRPGIAVCNLPTLRTELHRTTRNSSGRGETSPRF